MTGNATRTRIAKAKTAIQVSEVYMNHGLGARGKKPSALARKISEKYAAYLPGKGPFHGVNKFHGAIDNKEMRGDRG
jgi:hypothetical protein